MGKNAITAGDMRQERSARRQGKATSRDKQALTDGEDELDSRHGLPARGALVGGEGFVDARSNDGSDVEEELERDDDEAAEGSRDNFSLIRAAVEEEVRVGVRSSYRILFLRDVDFYQSDGDVDNNTANDELRITARPNASIGGSNLD